MSSFNVQWPRFAVPRMGGCLHILNTHPIRPVSWIEHPAHHEKSRFKDKQVRFLGRPHLESDVFSMNRSTLDCCPVISLIALRPPAGYLTWPQVGWHRPFVIDWWYRWGLPQSQWIWGSRDRWELIFRRPLTVSLRSPVVRTVRGDCERLQVHTLWAGLPVHEAGGICNGPDLRWRLVITMKCICQLQSLKWLCGCSLWLL